MSTNIKRYLNPSLGALLLFISVVAVGAIARQSLHMNTQPIKAKEATALNGLKLELKTKARYFLGETPNLKIVRTNNGRSPQKVKEAQFEKFSLELSGLLENDSEQQQRTIVYDGSWDIPKEPGRAKRGETHVFEELKKREPRFVQLSPGKSTTLELDLAKTFGSYLGVSKYKLTVKSEDGDKVVKEFEVYFDGEKSVPVLAKMLASEDEAERNWAVFNLAKFRRPKLITLLEKLVRSGTEKQRAFASGMLAQTKAGWFDPLKLSVESKDRYSLGETPIVAISLKNSGSAPATVKEAEGQTFSLSLKKLLGSDSREETKTCVYKEDDPQRKFKLVTLGETDSIRLSLNLTECFGMRFDIGKYELSVRAVDEAALKDQTVVKKFEVTSGPAPAHISNYKPGCDCGGERFDRGNLDPGVRVH